MVNYVRGKVHYAKESGGLIWFHIYSWHGRGWISISKKIFDHSMRNRLIKEIYGTNNKKIQKHIKILEKEASKLRKQGRAAEAKSREYHIHALRLKIKKDLHVHDLVGKRITLRFD
ncbi:hypothetical protein KY343_06780 [Candidatus Woesearchaeota archaeon]|nr:hypothetical protein [Candidatus Woesearchaeota archaeon]